VLGIEIGCQLHHFQDLGALRLVQVLDLLPPVQHALRPAAEEAPDQAEQRRNDGDALA